MMTKTIAISFVFLCFIPTFIWGQSKVSPQTENLIYSINEENNLKEREENVLKKFLVQELDNEKYVSAFIQINKKNVSILEKYGVRTNTILSNITTAQIPIDAIGEISKLDEVKYVEIAERVTLNMDTARVYANVEQVQAGVDIPQTFTGKGVVVGIVDFGMKFAHINFYNTEGADLRVKRVWNQNDKTGLSPEGFNYGSEYTTTQEMTEKDYDANITSHGTHVTGIATGAYKDDKISFQGVAPDAEVVLVSFLNEATATTTVNAFDGLVYIFRYADSVGKPCVVNMSLGEPNGAHDGTSSFDIGCNEILGKGRLLVGSIGNDGLNKVHVSKRFESSTDTLKTSLYYGRNTYTLPDGATFWGEEGNSFSMKIIVYNTQTNKTLFESDWFNTDESRRKNYYLENHLHQSKGGFSISTGINASNNKPYGLLSSIAGAPLSFFSNVRLSIIITAEKGTVHGWPQRAQHYFSNLGLDDWTDGDSDYTTGEIGGTGEKIITVGSYTSRVSYPILDGHVVNGNREKLGKISNFSSKGPTVDGRMKPDITAPGDYIASSVFETNEGTPRVAKVEKDGKTYYFGVMQGTSMASPFATGVLATWLEANNDLSPDDIRRIFQKTAINDEFTGDIRETGNNTWGYGKIDAWGGIKEAIKLVSIESLEYGKENTKKNGSILYSNPDKGELNLMFLEDKANVSITVYAVDGTIIYKDFVSQATASQEVSINSANLIKSGMYIISVKDDKRHESHRAIIR